MFPFDHPKKPKVLRCFQGDPRGEMGTKELTGLYDGKSNFKTHIFLSVCNL